MLDEPGWTVRRNGRSRGLARRPVPVHLQVRGLHRHPDGRAWGQGELGDRRGRDIGKDAGQGVDVQPYPVGKQGEPGDRARPSVARARPARVAGSWSRTALGRTAIRTSPGGVGSGGDDPSATCNVDVRPAGRILGTG